MIREEEWTPPPPQGFWGEVGIPGWLQEGVLEEAAVDDEEEELWGE